jgi:hypothetical protein
MNSRQRRTFNRAVERAVQSTGTREQSKTKQKALPEPLAPPEKLRRKLWRWSKKSYFFVAGCLGLLALLYELWPVVSIEPYLYLNPENLFSAKFNIFNESPYVLHGVTYECGLNDVETESHVTIKHAVGKDPSTHPISQIGARQKISVTCAFPIAMEHLIKAEIDFRLSYPLPHLPYWQITKYTCFH